MPRRKTITDDLILERALRVIVRVRVWKCARRRPGGGLARRQSHGAALAVFDGMARARMGLLRAAIMVRLPPRRSPAATEAPGLPPVPAAG